MPTSPRCALPPEVMAIIAHWVCVARRRDVHAAIRNQMVRVHSGTRAVFIICETSNYYSVLDVEDKAAA
jgi:hypothetical protein